MLAEQCPENPAPAQNQDSCATRNRIAACFQLICDDCVLCNFIFHVFNPSV